METSPSVFDDLLKTAPPLKPASAAPTGPSSVFDDLLSAAPPIQAASPAVSNEDEPIYNPGNNLPPTRYGRDTSGRLTSKWNGSTWVDLFNGRKVGAPAREESEAATPPQPSVPGMEYAGGVPPGPPVPPRPALPWELSTQQPTVEASKNIPGAMIDITTGSVGRIAQGVEQAAGPLQSFVVGKPGAPGMPRQSTLTSEQGRQLAAGGANILGGAFGLATPLVAGAGAAAPIQTLITLAAGTAASKGTEAGLKALGVAPEYADLGGNIAALLAGYAAAKVRLSPEQQTLIEVLRGKDAPEAAGRTMDGLKAMADRGGTQGERDIARDLLQRKFGLDYGTGNAEPLPQQPVSETDETPAAPRPPMGPPEAAGPPESQPPPTTGQAQPAQAEATETQPPSTTAPLPSITKGAVLPSSQGDLTVKRVLGGQVFFARADGTKADLPRAEFEALLTAAPQSTPATPPSASETPESILAQAPPAQAAPSATSGEPGSVQVGDVYQGKSGKYQVLESDKTWTRYQFTNSQGVQSSAQMSTPAFQRVVAKGSKVSSGAPAGESAVPGPPVQPSPAETGAEPAQAPPVAPPEAPIAAASAESGEPAAPPETAIPPATPPETPIAAALTETGETVPPINYAGIAAQAGGTSEAQPVHEHSSTQGNMPPELSKAVATYSQAIPDADLNPNPSEPNARQPENDIHVTVKYRAGDGPAAVEKLLAGQEPVTLTLGKTSVFSNDDGDVLKVGVVDSPQLHDLNAKLTKAFPHPDDFPDYKPHVTVAYLKSGEGKKYSGQDVPGVTGQTVTLNSITYSGKDGKQTEIPLTGSAALQSQRVPQQGGPGEKVPSTQPQQPGEGTKLFRGYSDSPKPRHAVPGETESNQAEWYAENRQVAEFFANGGRTPPGVLYPDAHVTEAQVTLKNPLVIDMADPSNAPKDQSAKSWNDTARDTGEAVHEIGFIKEKALRRARANGNDGVIFLHGYDGRPYSGRIVAVLKPGPSESTAQHSPAASSNTRAGAAPGTATVAPAGESAPPNAGTTTPTPSQEQGPSKLQRELEATQLATKWTPAAKKSYGLKYIDWWRDGKKGAEPKAPKLAPPVLKAAKDALEKILEPAAAPAPPVESGEAPGPIAGTGEGTKSEAPASTIAKPEETPTLESEGNGTSTPSRSGSAEGEGALAEVPPEDVGTPPAAGQARPHGVGSNEPDEGDAGRPGGQGAGLQPGAGAVPPDRVPTGRRGRPQSASQPSTSHDYRITAADQIGQGGDKAKFKANLDAIRTLKKVEEEGRPATPEEQSILAKYVGWGSLSQTAFDSWRSEWRGAQEELQGLVTDAEYEAARKSTLNAHYTSPDVVSGMWKAIQRLGANSADLSVLEPAMGVGNFFGLMPEELLPAQRTGVEIDSLSGRIAKLLYPSANIQISPFEKMALPNDYFDLAVSNVPFGKFGVHDAAYRRHPQLTSSIHNYFFVKALDKVRPGGIVAFVTSAFSMDAKDPGIRKYLASKANLLGAIRLPGGKKGAFAQNAGTEVTTDILFLQKREPQTEASGEKWENLAEVDGIDDKGQPTKISVNEYYTRHPEMMLGQMALQGTMYGPDKSKVLLGEMTPEALAKAIENLPTNVFSERQVEDSKAFNANPIHELPNAGEIKDGAYGLKDGVVIVRTGATYSTASLSAPAAERVKGMMGVRDAVREVFRTQLTDASDEAVDAARKALNTLYDGFVKKHGPLNSPDNIKAFFGDPDAPLLASLEDYVREDRTSKKRQIFTQRTIEKYKPLEKVENSSDALAVSLAEVGRLDWMRMQELTGKTPEQMQQELAGVIYRNPEGHRWETADDYLSGNVRAKLAIAENAAATNPDYQSNVEALQAVVPKDLMPSQINARLGASWIPREEIAAFISDLLGVSQWQQDQIKVGHAGVLGTWTVQVGDQIKNMVANTNTWGHGDYSGHELIEKALNLQYPTVYMEVPTDDGKETKRVVDKKGTLAAQEKQNKIKAAFKKWIWEDGERAQRLSRKYNDEFNNLRLREYDGAHLTFPGMARLGLRKQDLDPHQKNAVWRIVQNGNTLLAHVVGAGKTFEMIAAGMELKRMGLIKKPMFVVPNHLVEQWGGDFLRLYPSANIFVAGKDYFTTGNRQQAMSRIATGNYDAVIVAHRSFQFLPVSDETITSFMHEQLHDIDIALAEAQRAEAADESASYGRRRGKPKQSRTVKQLEAARARIEKQIEDRAKREQSDKTISFEELGVDHLFVDEAHMFKNLYYPTKMTRVAGLPNSQSDRAMDMFIKTQYLTRLHNGKRGVVFATGTPISNSMAEMFTMQRYLQMDYLKEAGIQAFDSWAQNFGEPVTGMELAPEGSGFRMNTRFSRFINLPELLTAFRTVADVKTAEDLKLPVPAMKGGKPIIISVPATPELKGFIGHLGQRAQAIRSGKVRPDQDNMLAVVGEGRKAALDMRLVAPGLPDNPTSKVNVCVDQLAKIWKDTKAQKSTQLLFLDLGTPRAASEAKRGKKGAIPANGDVQVAAPDDAQSTSVYQDIRKKLIRKGVYPGDIAFIHDAKDDAAKQALFDDMNTGRKRILLGSTEKMGAGMNVQRKLIALHHLDAPWRPSDVEQRDGRGLRQGNENPEIALYRYVTEDSFDAYMWQTLLNKGKMVAQGMSGDLSIRELEDIGVFQLSASEAMALASGNPEVRERIEVEMQVRRLESLAEAHEDQVRRARWEVASLPGKLDSYRKDKAHWEGMIAQRNAWPIDQDAWKLNEPGFVPKDATERNKKLIELIRSTRGEKTNRTVGSYKGFPIVSVGQGSRSYKVDGKEHIELNDPHLEVAGISTYFNTGRGLAGETPEHLASMAAYIRNAVDSSPEGSLRDVNEKLQKDEARFRDLQSELNVPFEHQAKLEALQTRLNELNTKLEIDKPDAQAVDLEAKEDGADALHKIDHIAPMMVETLHAAQKETVQRGTDQRSLDPGGARGETGETGIGRGVRPALSRGGGTRYSLTPGIPAGREPGNSPDETAGVKPDDITGEESRIPAAYDFSALSTQVDASRIPSLPASSQRFIRGAPDIAHATSMRFAQVDLRPEDQTHAVAYVTNRSGVEYIYRSMGRAKDDAGPSVDGSHLSPQVAGIVGELARERSARMAHPPKALLELTRIAREASEANKSLVLVVASAGQTKEEIADTLQEELDHALQATLGTNRSAREHLGTNTDAFLEHPLAVKAKQNLETLRSYDLSEAGRAAAELSVRLLRPGAYQQLGLSAEEAAILGEHYLALLQKEYGDVPISEFRRKLESTRRQVDSGVVRLSPTGSSGNMVGGRATQQRDPESTTGSGQTPGLPEKPAQTSENEPEANGGEGPATREVPPEIDESRAPYDFSALSTQAQSLSDDDLKAQYPALLKAAESAERRKLVEPGLAEFAKELHQDQNWKTLRSLFQHGFAEAAQHAPAPRVPKTAPKAAPSTAAPASLAETGGGGSAIPPANAAPPAGAPLPPHGVPGPNAPSAVVPESAATPGTAPGPRNLPDLFRSYRDRFIHRFGFDLPDTSVSSYLAFKDYTVREMSQLQAIEPQAYLALRHEVGSRAQSQVLINAVAPRVKAALKDSGISWKMFRAAILESRLRGARQRWRELAESAGKLETLDEAVNAYNGGMRDLLETLEGRRGMDDFLKQDADAMLANEDIGALAEFLGENFNKAADHVGTMNLVIGSHQNAFEEITQNAGFQRALGIYKEHLEGPLAKNHASNEGIFSTALGPLDTYYPAIPVADEDRPKMIMGRRIPYRKPGNPANAFFSGLGEYTLAMDAFAQRIAAALKINNRAAAIQALEDHGLSLDIPPGAQPPRMTLPDGRQIPVINIDGKDYPAIIKEVRPARTIFDKGKAVHLPAKSELIPQWLAKELEPVLEPDGNASKIPNMAERITGLLNTFALQGLFDPVFHSTNVLGTLVVKTPFAGTGILSKTIGNTPVTKIFTAILNTIRQDVTSEDALRIIQHLADLALIPGRFGKETYSKTYAQETGATLRNFTFGPALFGPHGLDIKARVLMYRVAHDINPDISDTELVEFIRNLGEYNRELEGRLERILKDTALGPFATAGATMYRNSVTPWLGGGKMPKAAPWSGKLEPLNGIIPRGAGLRLSLLLSGSAIGLIAMWMVANKVLTGKWTGNQLFKTDITGPLRDSQVGRAIWGSNAHPGTINWAFFSPLADRGGRTLGISSAYATAMAGGTFGQSLESAQKDMFNSVGHPMTSGPLFKALFVATFGKEPYLTGWRDRSGVFGPQLRLGIAKLPAGIPTLGARLGEGLLNVNSFYQNIAAAFGLGEKGNMGAEDRGERWLRTITDVAAPRLLSQAYNVDATRRALQQQAKAAATPPHAARSGSFHYFASRNQVGSPFGKF
jgi:N12 class adenine-specific DNA methylase